MVPRDTREEGGIKGLLIAWIKGVSMKIQAL